MLLIVADFWKAFWFLVFPAVSLGVGQIPTSSPFCQAGGFFVQSTLEAVGQYRIDGQMLACD